MTTIDRFREDGEGVRRIFVLAEVRFADRGATPRDEYDHNYYDDTELKSVATEWMGDGVSDRDDSPSVRFKDVPPEMLDALRQLFRTGEDEG